MSGKPDKERQKGFSLIELLIVVVILGILVALAINSFRETNEKYKIESATKEMFADIMDVRARALQRNRVSFVSVMSNSYETYEDTNPLPDGNGILEPVNPSASVGGTNNSDTRVTRVDRESGKLKGAYVFDVGGGLMLSHGSTPTESFRFNRNGIASADGFIRIRFPQNPNLRPDYDCIRISPTRVKTGQFNTVGGTCVEK